MFVIQHSHKNTNYPLPSSRHQLGLGQLPWRSGFSQRNIKKENNSGVIQTTFRLKKKNIQQKYPKSHIPVRKKPFLFLIQKFPSQKTSGKKQKKHHHILLQPAPHLIVEGFCCGAATPGHQGLRNTAILNGFCHQVLLTTTHFTQQNHPQWPVGVLLKFWCWFFCGKRTFETPFESTRQQLKIH